MYSVRKNAGVFLEIQKECGNFDTYIWGFLVGTTKTGSMEDISVSISKDLKKRGMTFVGPTIIYSYMQAIGMFDPHENTCYRHHLCSNSFPDSVGAETLKKVGVFPLRKKRVPNEETDMIYEGGCLCGDTTYEAKGEPINPHLCSCTMCQKSSGAPTVGWVEFPLSDFKWTKAQPKLYRSSEKTDRCSCERCGGLLGTYNEGFSNICLTISTMNNPSLIVPGKQHSYIESKPSWWQPKVVLSDKGSKRKKLDRDDSDNPEVCPTPKELR